MKFKELIIFLLILAIVFLSGCGQNGDNGETEQPPTIIPAPVGEISEEELTLLEVNETECNTGEEFVPKVKYTWKWSEIPTDFCENYYCDATQFSIALLKKINNLIKNEQINKDLEFDALLMKDGFSGTFQKDFDEYMKQKNFLDTPSFYLDGELGEIFPDKNKFVFAASEIGKPGKYKVKVTYPKNISEGIVVEFEFVSSDVLNNPFYYLPFNGRIGDDRQGYGLGYNADKENEVMVSEELSLSNQSPATGKFNATVKKTQDFRTANAPATRGTVLKLEADPLGESRTIEFSPLLATPVLMHSKADTSNANSIALLYRMTENGLMEIVPNNSFLTWQPLEQCTSYNRQANPIKDTRNTSEPSGYMIFNDLSDLTEEEKINGNVYYKTVTEKIIPEGDLEIQSVIISDTTTPHSEPLNVKIEIYNNSDSRIQRLMLNVFINDELYKRYYINEGLNQKSKLTYELNDLIFREDQIGFNQIKLEIVPLQEFTDRQPENKEKTLTAATA